MPELFSLTDKNDGKVTAQNVGSQGAPFAQKPQALQQKPQLPGGSSPLVFDLGGNEASPRVLPATKPADVIEEVKRVEPAAVKQAPDVPVRPSMLPSLFNGRKQQLPEGATVKARVDEVIDAGVEIGTKLVAAEELDKAPSSESREVAARNRNMARFSPEEVSSEAQRERMRQILLELGVSAHHVNIAMRRSAQTNETLAQIMADFGFLSGEGVAEAVSKLNQMPWFRAEDMEKINVSEFKGITIKKFERFVPVGLSPRGELKVAISDASQINTATNAFFGKKVIPVIASEHTIQAIYRKYFANTETAFDNAVEAFIKAEESSSATRHVTQQTDAVGGQVADVYFAMLRHACYSGASDLYLYRSAMIGILKLKINGVGQIFRTLDIRLYDRLLNKLVQDNTKGDELRRKPKEAVVEIKGSDAVKYSDLAERFGFRLELTESRGVRNAVIRVLDKNSSATDLKNLGFDDATYKTINRISRSSTGFFLVTGPTGSGKTTSLYAILKSIDAVERSIQSIENPVEYRHGLWQQYELRKDSENESEDYNEWLKALLRNAPDVILVGEVRDRDVANICLNAANTGHLVFATLHTNNATLAVARLKSLNIDMDVLGSVLLGILAQRLTRLLCDKCKVPDNSPEIVEALKEPYLKDVLVHKPHRAGAGCPDCDHTGYRGRRMVYELLEMNAGVRLALEKGEAPSVIAEKGMNPERTMWATGMRMVASGLTSLEELERVATKSF